MSRLHTVVNNIDFINPFVLASGPPTRTGEMIARAFRLGWGGAVIKTVTFNYEKMVNASPRMVKVENGLQNIELISDRSPEVWAEEIRALKTEFPQNIVIASIAAEATNFEDWKQLALLMQGSGADVIELNLSCPHGLPEMNMGSTCCDVPEITGNIVKAVKEVTLVPVWAKLSPNVTSIKYLAEVCLENGADGITAINTVKGFAGVDIQTGMPKLNVNGGSSYGGISGKVIKPLALKAVSEIFAENNCNVSASGGISGWQDAVEFVLLGASTVQICTEVMLSGFEIIDDLKQGMECYLEEKNHNFLEEIKGKSINYVNSFTKLHKSFITSPILNKKTCLKCGKCALACSDAGYQAIEFPSGNFPYISDTKCSGCGLCTAVCPARSLVMQVGEKICSQRGY